jgi:hypothetical protein
MNLNEEIPSLMASNSASSGSQSDGNTIILMINNLCSSKFNCDRLFNLLCLYGNVIGVSSPSQTNATVRKEETTNVILSI